MQAHGPGADELCSRRVDRPGRCCMNGHRKPRHRVNHRHTMVWLRSARRPVAPARVVVSGLVMVCAVMICEVMHGVERNAAVSPVFPRCGVLNIFAWVLVVQPGHGWRDVCADLLFRQLAAGSATLAGASGIGRLLLCRATRCV